MTLLEIKEVVKNLSGSFLSTENVSEIQRICEIAEVPYENKYGTILRIFLVGDQLHFIGSGDRYKTIATLECVLNHKDYIGKGGELNFDKMQEDCESIERINIESPVLDIGDEKYILCFKTKTEIPIQDEPEEEYPSLIGFNNIFADIDRAIINSQISNSKIMSASITYSWINACIITDSYIYDKCITEEVINRSCKYKPLE